MIKLRRALQQSGAAVVLTTGTAGAFVVASFIAAWWLWQRDEAWARAQLFAAATFALFFAAVIYEICNPAPARPEDPVSGTIAEERFDVVTKADDLLTRIRTDYTQVGANLATLLGFVATGGGVIALTSGNGTAVTPLIICAAISILAVLVLCLLGLRPEYHAATTTTAQEFSKWLEQANEQADKFNQYYVYDLFHRCDRYERFRRIRRTYYIYAGWCFILALTAVGLNALHSDCSLKSDSVRAPCAEAAAAAARKK